MHQAARIIEDLRPSSPVEPGALPLRWILTREFAGSVRVSGQTSLETVELPSASAAHGVHRMVQGGADQHRQVRQASKCWCLCTHPNHVGGAGARRRCGFDPGSVRVLAGLAGAAAPGRGSRGTERALQPNKGTLLSRSAAAA